MSIFKVVMSPNEEYVMVLLQHLIDEYGLSAKCNITDTIERSDVKRDTNGDLLIRISVQQLIDVAERGFKEYYRLRRYVPKVWYGQQAVHQLILHEFAHVLALVHDNEHIHGPHYKRWYVKLMRQFTYRRSMT
jgi:hypothetical protein